MRQVVRWMVVVLVLYAPARRGLADPPSGRGGVNEPSGYSCGSNGMPDPPKGCRCRLGERPDRNSDNEAVCVACPSGQVVIQKASDLICGPPPTLRYTPPSLRAPADKSIEVTENTRFIVDAPAWSDAIQIEVCIDASCLKPRLIVSDAPVAERQASFALGKLPEERLLYWRAKGRKQGKVMDPPSETRSFKRKAMAPPAAGTGTATKTDRPKIGRPELAIMDAAIAAGDFERLVDLAQLSTQAAQHIEIALRLANADQCSDLLRVLALPVESGDGFDAEIRQLGADCATKLDQAHHTSTIWTIKRKVATAVAGVSVAGMITGTVLGVQAKSKYNAAHEICSDTRAPCVNADRVNELIKEARSRAFSADIVFGVAGAAAIGASVLWFIGAPETRARRLDITPTMAPGRAGVAVYGTF